MDRRDRHRARLKDGKIVLNLVVDRVAVEEALIEARWLTPGDRDDRQAVVSAFEIAHCRVVIQDRDASPNDDCDRHTIQGDDEEN